MPPAVHLAFRFHVNFVHSYRGDTPDERGFGKDIRVIRGIVRALDEANARGIPVRGTWDIENHYSLATVMPRHCPDLIEAIRRRVRENGDEVEVMSWNNGLVSAHTAVGVRRGHLARGLARGRRGPARPVREHRTRGAAAGDDVHPREHRAVPAARHRGDQPVLQRPAVQRVQHVRRPAPPRAAAQPAAARSPRHPRLHDPAACREPRGRRGPPLPSRVAEAAPPVPAIDAGAARSAAPGRLRCRRRVLVRLRVARGEPPARRGRRSRAPHRERGRAPVPALHHARGVPARPRACRHDHDPAGHRGRQLRRVRELGGEVDQPGPVDGRRAVAARGAAGAPSPAGARRSRRRRRSTGAARARIRAAPPRALDDLFRARLAAGERRATRSGREARRLRRDTGCAGARTGAGSVPRRAEIAPGRHLLRRSRLPARRSDRRSPLPAATVAIARKRSPGHRCRQGDRAGR